MILKLQDALKIVLKSFSNLYNMSFGLKEHSNLLFPVNLSMIHLSIERSYVKRK